MLYKKSFSFIAFFLHRIHELSPFSSMTIFIINSEKHTSASNDNINCKFKEIMTDRPTNRLTYQPTDGQEKS